MSSKRQSKANAKPTKLGNKSTQPSGQVRIIGGAFKRRLISFIDADGLRPTPDRLRETLFNWLTADLHDAAVLDVCAGSGVLGFEAISRGAKSAVMIEANAAQARTLTQSAATLKIHAPNLQALQNGGAHIIHSTAQNALPLLDAPFDVIFLDPPYALNLWHELITLIITHGLYHQDTLIYLESDQPLTDIIAPFDKLELIKSAKVGQVFAGLAVFND
ncbi:16S rRNA (guanine(966)-N(2))-methyltransferase RsmD [Moraxella caviae]|uniref:Ribosomal RNA small subunit methyltransferase D n=1 Tax=Moraxella caviae TaxID=34060 RepID=A0A1T0A5K8_9GAMM|nr:16S rRNA (guanine(966)-N(2))-methyltransferase RsmD [Moraxella caviae]OOR91072.1 16S rRNA (guanine(966)-N(2))-methyltransferase RsmD [Moraxella caviae]STZ14232.1 Ribosomal RNA small subunit methyltransferase D [Moraxella caviae]VEW13168.1 Ribosomal RNA small subunit methyltransferase D [Moraxella caviae]